MNTLANVHCLGCKKRHEMVDVKEVKTLSVKGSPRYQGRGVCPEGKTWTKILNKTERTTLAHLIEKEVQRSEEIEVIPPDSTSVTKKTVAPNPSNHAVIDLSIDSKTDKEKDILSMFEETSNELSLPSTTPSAERLKVEEVIRNDPKTVAQDSRTESKRTLSTLDVEPLQGFEKTKEVGKGTAVSEVEGLRRDLRTIHRPKRKGGVDTRSRLEPQEVTYQVSGEQAFKYGRHYGYNEASFSKERFKEGISFHFKQSRVHQNFFDDFTRGYIEGGETYLINEHHVQDFEEAASDAPISPTTTAGLAAASIFGAWVASKIKRGV